MTARAKLFWAVVLASGLAVLSFGQVPPVPAVKRITVCS